MARIIINPKPIVAIGDSQGNIPIAAGTISPVALRDSTKRKNHVIPDDRVY
jgi:hypothetical protein